MLVRPGDRLQVFGIHCLEPQTGSRRQLGGDAPLMAGIIASQTVLAGLALPAVMLAHAQLWP